MKIRSYSLLLVPLLALTGCDQMQSSLETAKTADNAVAPAADTGDVVVTVNGKTISKTVLDVYSGQREAKGAQDASRDSILNELIALELMRQEADNKGLGSQPVVIASINQLQRSALAGAAIKDFMEKNPVTDADARAYYDEKINIPGKEFKARHILVDTEDDAKAIISMLDSGKDFSELAKQKSTDSSAASGGDLGWFRPGQMVKEFADAAAALEKGHYTKTPVKTQFGWHVIMLDDVRDTTPPPFDDIKDRLKLGLAQQKLQKHMAELRKAATIVIAGGDTGGTDDSGQADSAEESGTSGQTDSPDSTGESGQQ